MRKAVENNPQCVRKKILILGIGNTLMGDDGVGVNVIQYIEKSGMRLPEDVDILDGGTAGYDLLGLIDGYDKIVIVDALRVQDRPGSVYRLPVDRVRQTVAARSTHATGIMDVIRMLGIVGRIPDIEFIGIVPENTGELNTRLSRAVEDAIPRAVEAALEAATQYTGGSAYVSE